MNRIKTITLGCRFNVYETEIVKSILKSLEPKDEIVFINTCSVTQQAENQSKQAVRRAIREHPNAKIIVTGCTVTTAKDYYETLDGVFAVIPNDDKTNIETYKNIPHNIESISNDMPLVEPLFQDRVKAFLQIQCGCDNFCTYCIVPFARGRSRSMPVSEIIRQINFLIDHDFKEIILSGIDITSYNDNGLNFSGVVRCILDTVPRLQRLRISSVNPHGIDDEFIELMKNPKIMPHLHLSIQSGNTDVLKAMRRKYNVASLSDIINRLKQARMDLVLGADVIAGFPTETDAQFENSYDYIKNSGISLLHVFPYSPRPGTVASRMMQLPRSVVLARAKKLRQLNKELRSNLQQSLVGTKVSGLVEKSENGCSFGKTDNFLDFMINEEIPINTVVKQFKIIGVQNDKLVTTLESHTGDKICGMV